MNTFLNQWSGRAIATYGASTSQEPRRAGAGRTNSEIVGRPIRPRDRGSLLLGHTNARFGQHVHRISNGRPRALRAGGLRIQGSSEASFVSR